MKSIFTAWLKLLFLLSFSALAFAHNGSHESQACFINVAENQLRFSGYQFQGLHPDASYCRVFPFLGTLLIKIETMNASAANYKIALKFNKLNGFSAIIGDENEAVTVLKTTPFQSFKEVVLLQSQVTERGLYALDILLQDNRPSTIRQRFYMLVGIPVTQILVLFSLGLLIVLIGLFVNSHRKAALTEPKLG